MNQKRKSFSQIDHRLTISCLQRERANNSSRLKKILSYQMWNSEKKLVLTKKHAYTIRYVTCPSFRNHRKLVDRHWRHPLLCSLGAAEAEKLFKRSEGDKNTSQSVSRVVVYWMHVWKLSINCSLNSLFQSSHLLNYYNSNLKFQSIKWFHKSLPL